MKRPPVGIIGPDGIQRNESEEKRINNAFDVTFRPESGKAVMDYLKSITIQVAAGPEATDQYLRHLEGQRYIVGLISKRIELGIKKRRNELNE